MKKYLLFVFSAIFCGFVFAQSPQYIPYQAVARNAAGNLLVNQNVSLRFTIHESSGSGTIDYQETQSATTNGLGLFSVNIGNGTPVTGTLGAIPWANGTPKFTQVEIDPTGGNSYSNMGASQMMSVPYALYAGSAASAGGNAGGDLTGSYPNPTIAANKVTYADIQKESTGTILGNNTGSAASPSELTLGIGLGFNGTSQLINTSPDQIVGFTNGTGIAVTGSYPNFTVTNTKPDQTVTITGTGITVGGVYPSFSLTSNNNGTVTSVATTLPITGGTITGSGTIACATCATTTNGGALSATAPVAISAAGVISLNPGSTGSVPYYNGSSWVLNATNLYDDGANIGVGTTSPISNLQVAGALTVGPYNSAGVVGNAQITTGGTSPISNRLTYGTDGTGWKFAISKNQGGTLTDQLILQDNGYLGIGTSSPGYLLDVNGEARFSASGGGGASAVIVNAGGPSYAWDVNGQATDQKWWDLLGSGTTLLGRAVNDANSSATTWLQVNRGTGFTVSSVVFPSGNFAISNLAGTGNRPVFASSTGVLTTGGALPGQSLTKVPFSYTGGNQTWVVPANVNQVYFKLWGAGGAGANTNYGPGGGGGFVSGVLAVTPGNTLYIVVGGAGQTSRTNAFGGGGAGTGTNSGGGGGGRSAIMTSSSNSDVVTAGGGGGGAHNCYCYGGGGGGGLVGGYCTSGNCPGAPGTQSSAGTVSGSCSGYTSGTQYAGGNACTSTWGGGGGGGYYGGAPGGCTNSEGSGGGGSSYVSGLNLLYGMRNEQGSFNNNINTSGASSTTYLPGGYYDPDYPAGVGTGGAAGSNGGNGYVVIYY